MRLPDGDGLELVEEIQQGHPDLPVAVITAHGSMDSAVQALKLGAFDFVSKPVDLQVLRNLVNSALKLSDAHALVLGEYTDDHWLAKSLAGVGDVDADGFDDVLIAQEEKSQGPGGASNWKGSSFMCKA